MKLVDAPPMVTVMTSRSTSSNPDVSTVGFRTARRKNVSVARKRVPFTVATNPNVEIDMQEYLLLPTPGPNKAKP